MTVDEHCKQLGGLLGNLQSLECCLRIFLHHLPDARPLGVPFGTDIYTLPVGSDLPENELTSYESLGELIARYNREVLAHRAREQIDPALVIVRDALAHGRVSTNEENQPMRLLKFDRPRAGRVRITFNEEMTMDWFKKQKQKVLLGLKRVHEAYKTLTSRNEKA
jgi:hypothetical protein